MKEFKTPDELIPLYYISKVTGNKYNYNDYKNIGNGVGKYGYMDLPKDEYPYLIEYKK